MLLIFGQETSPPPPVSGPDSIIMLGIGEVPASIASFILFGFLPVSIPPAPGASPRIYIVGSESRLYAIEAESRIYAVEVE